jgi:hypothetical protein
VFNVELNDDFINHETAAPALVLDHKLGKAGPDPEKLQFDMRHGSDTPWNRTVMDILLVKLKAAREDEQWSLPEMTDAYFMNLLEERYRRARNAWMDAQPKKTEMGVDETFDNVEQRLLNKKEGYLKKVRTNRRRETVSTYIASWS